ncbi:MAG: hypothetical protein ACTH6N_04975 [Brachybacterium tyrofermentans]|uniref:hypothetical protein n=1 Tax=Brachybacterium tyrofermentans TaxID=47848 RepID=UPI0018675F04|nr:hypothetical protein [Brachybacterium tyrofermentans]
MAHTEQLLLEIRGALDQLSRTAQAEQDSSRGTVARNLAVTFSGVMDRSTLRDAARESLALFRGGMGSFQDVGTAPMADAVQRLHRALSRASQRW